MQRCGRVRFRRHVDVVAAGGSAWFDGVQRCRARICPVCWIARRAQLAHEISHVVNARRAETGAVPLLATLTVRHSADDPVSLCRAVRACWRKFIAGKSWSDYRAAAGLEWVIAEEVTHGSNGWHPHMHALLLARQHPDDLLARADWWFERWHAIVVRELGAEHAPLPDVGTDLRPCDTAQYLTKLGIELQDPDARKGRAPLALLEAGALDLYIELQLSRHRARDLTWSRGLAPYRATMPPPPPTEVLLRLRGSEFGRLHSAGGDEALLDVLEAAHGGDPGFVAEWWVGPLAGAEPPARGVKYRLARARVFSSF